jgi:hypothetical protein
MDPLQTPASELEDPWSSWCARAKRCSSAGALAMGPLKSRNLGVKSALQIKGCASHPSLLSSTTIITFVAIFLKHFQFEIYLRAFRGLLVATEGYTQSSSLLLPEHIQVSGHRVEFP